MNVSTWVSRCVGLALVTASLAGCIHPHEKASISGTVTDAATGRVLPDAVVYANSGTGRTTTDARGYYRIGSLDEGQYTLHVERVGYVAGTSGAHANAGRSVTCNVALTPEGTPLGAISGSVLDDANQPVSAASVTTDPVTSTAATDAGGNFGIAAVAPGHYEVTVRHAGFTDAVSGVDVVADSTAYVVVHLHSGAVTTGTLTGTVRDALTNLPLAGASVTTDPASVSASTDAAGNYTLHGVAAGHRDVLVALAGYQAFRQGADVTAGATTRVDASLLAANVYREQEDNGSSSTANLVFPLQTIYGHVGPQGTDDADLFKVVVPGTMNGLLRYRVYDLNASGTANGTIGRCDIETEAQAELASNGGYTSAGANEAVGPVPVTAGAVYYVTVSHYATTHSGAYRIEPDFTAGSVADAAEPNDSPGTAVAIASEQAAMIGYGTSPDVEDWYAVTAPAAGTLSVRITNLHPGGVAHGNVGAVTVYDAAQHALKSNGGYTSDGGTELLGPLTVTPGATYLVQVKRYGTLDAAPYRLNVTP